VPCPGPPAGTGDPPAPPQDALERERVALVGIEAELAGRLRAVLDDEDCEVTALADTDVLLERVTEGALDLVVIDLDSMGAEPGGITAEIKGASPQTMVMPLSGAVVRRDRHRGDAGGGL